MFRDGNDFLFIVSLSDLIAWPAIIGAHTGVLVAFNVVIALHYIVSKYSLETHLISLKLSTEGHPTLSSLIQKQFALSY